MTPPGVKHRGEVLSGLGADRHEIVIREVNKAAEVGVIPSGCQFEVVDEAIRREMGHRPSSLARVTWQRQSRDRPSNKVQLCLGMNPCKDSLGYVLGSGQNPGCGYP